MPGVCRSLHRFVRRGVIIERLAVARHSDVRRAGSAQELPLSGAGQRTVLALLLLRAGDVLPAIA
jgi:hypothetical protein